MGGAGGKHNLLLVGDRVQVEEEFLQAGVGGVMTDTRILGQGGDQTEEAIEALGASVGLGGMGGHGDGILAPRAR